MMASFGSLGGALRKETEVQSQEGKGLGGRSKGSRSGSALPLECLWEIDSESYQKKNSITSICSEEGRKEVALHGCRDGRRR